MSEIAEAARGRWAGLLPALGVSPTLLTGKHAPCPICAGGRDRFRFDDKDGRGTWICSQCGAGDGFSLAAKVSGRSFADVARQVEQLVGTVSVQERKAERSPEALRRALNRLWRSAVPITPDDPAGRYLVRRVGLTAFPSCLRYAAAQPYEGHADLFPCLVAKVSKADGLPVTLHRTFLTEDGHKANVPCPRKLMAGSFPKGSAVRLAAPTDVLGVAEGIETALAVSRLFDIPTWAALNAGNLSDWVWPAGVERLVVFGDNDTSYTGQQAAYALARRAKAKGVAVEVHIPAGADSDWNDVLANQLAQGVPA